MAENATIGALHVKLGLDSAQFETGLKSAQGALAQFGKMAGAAFAAVAAAASAGAVAAAIKSQIDALDEMSKAAQKAGVATKAFSELNYAAELSDVSTEQLTKGLGKLSQSMVAAAGDADGKAAKAFKALGVSVTDANGQLRPTEEIFRDVAGGFAGMEDGAGKTALAMSVFGKAGADLLPLLNSGKDGLAEMADEAARLGVVIDEETGKRAEAFNDNLTRLQTVGKGLTTQLAAALLPALEGITNAFVAVASNGEIMRGVGIGLGIVMKSLGTVVIAVGTAFANMARVVGAAGSVIGKILKGDFAGAGEAAKGVMLANLKASQTAALAVRDMWTATGSAVKTSAPKVGAQIAAPMEEGAKRTRAARKEIESEAEKAAKAVRAYLAAEQSAMVNDGLAQGERKAREAMVKAHEAYLLGLHKEAQELGEIAAAYRAGDIAAAKLTDTTVEFVRTVGDIKPEFETAFDAAVREMERVLDVFYRVEQAGDDLYYGLRNQDWAAAFSGLLRVLDQVKTAFSSTGTTADKFAAAAGVTSAIGNAVGGKTGKAISSAGNAGLAAFQATGNPYVAVAAAAIAGLSNLLGPKPTNHGAGIGLTPTGLGALSGNKRNAETENAALQTGRAILAGEEALRQAGLTLSTTVTGLVIGTRDLSQIYLSNGRTLTSAVGDASAAAEAALRGVLETATYASDAQRQVAQSALAAGKTFDEVLSVLSDFEAAQGIGQSIADQIQQLVDPKAFDLEAVRRDIQAQREAAKDALDKGYLTAEAFSAILTKLQTLEGLRLEEVLKRYGDTAADAAAQMQEQIAGAAGVVEDARGALAEAYADEIAALETTRDRLLDVADSLAEFRAELARGALSAIDPRRRLAIAQAEFDAAKGSSDPAVLAKLPELGRALIEAQRAVAPNARALNATVEQVAVAVGAAEASVRGQAAEIQAQIDALMANTVALGLQTQASATLAQREEALALAVIAQAEVMRAASQALGAATAELGGIVASAAAASSAAAAETAGAVNAVAALAAPPVGDESVAMEALLRQIMLNTGQGTRILDDVTQGGDSLRTAAV